MTTTSSALEGSFAYNSETSETSILPIYDNKNDNNISLILIVEVLENANISVAQVYEDTVRYNQINETEPLAQKLSSSGRFSLCRRDYRFDQYLYRIISFCRVLPDSFRGIYFQRYN